MGSEIVRLTVSLLMLLLTLALVTKGQAPGAVPGALPGAGPVSSTPGHPFCVSPPMVSTPRMPIYSMDVHTGFMRGYRTNQSVKVDITAKYPSVWKINQLFIHVPDPGITPILPPVAPGPNPAPTPGMAAMTPPPSNGHLGAWTWNLEGGSKPVDCGGTTTANFGYFAGLGADAAVLIWNEGGLTNVSAIWVPPTDYHNIFHRKTVTIEAYITFEKTPPEVRAGMGYGQAQRPSRWVKKTVSLVSLDYIDIQNYLQRLRLPMEMFNRMSRMLQ